MPRSRVLQGGRIVSTFILADMGELDFHSGVAYTPVDQETAEAIQALDVAVLENLKEALRPELECQVCYQIMLDPLTTSCGHTFCRRCFSRAIGPLKSLSHVSSCFTHGTLATSGIK